MQPDAVLAGERTEGLNQRPVDRLGVLAGSVDVEGADMPHLRQDDDVRVRGHGVDELEGAGDPVDTGSDSEQSSWIRATRTVMCRLYGRSRTDFTTVTP